MDIFVVAAVFCGIFIACWWSRDKGRYTYGRNGAVRQCDGCGQQQYMYCDSLENWSQTYWEANGEIKDSTCKCHEDTR